MASPEAWLLLEDGNDSNNITNVKPLSKDMRNGGVRTVHNLSSSSLRKKSDLVLLPKVRAPIFRRFLDHFSEVFLATKLSVLFVAIPFAIVAQCRHFASPWVFALSFVGLIPLAERVSFLTEQIAFYTGSTVGGLMNATCGNATELIIAIFALIQNKVDVVKFSLLGSILSNLLLVLGSSFFCGGMANMFKEQKFDRKQTDVNLLLLLLGLLCHVLPLMFKFTGQSPQLAAVAALELSRASAIIMLIAYILYLFFQLWTQKPLFDAPEGDEAAGLPEPEESPVIELWAAIVWLILMTLAVALLSEYIVDTIEAASNTWGMSVGFISVILLPIVGNAAEHAAAIIFAFKNKLDISLGVALGSATQISMFVVPLTVLVSWMLGGTMDLDLNLLQTSALTLAIIITTFTLQDGTSNYIKGLVLMLSYLVIGACFFVYKAPLNANIVETW
ncbi:vacuolar cation/proton exchanger 3-like isoform X2 [Andrographis paniculata]|uniref:vacuolar cation/proton exchanger 3-like isoform X2 n=1 Tax=Andrographis paniculata TaxID=175694 RepID=UPI0021E8CECB|nr:vacuolar cation/proton exchanger 3-like isoform X2 [Andrographis paniculata]